MIYMHVIEHDSGSKPWVAVITGARPRFGYARTFVRPRRDYKESVKRMSGRVVGIRSCFLLEDGWVCEFYEQHNSYDSAKKTKRYFAQVTHEGLTKVAEDEVITCLRQRR